MHRSAAFGVGLGALCALAPPSAVAAQARFTELSHNGLSFRHDPGTEGRYRLPEITGPGAAFLDYDGDGDLDVYLIQGGQPSDPIASRPDAEPNRLYRQESDGSFVDVTDASGLGDRGYGMGVAVGDIDNDGRVDVFVSNYGPDRLYRNEGGGRFADVTHEWGVAGSAWSASAVFCDYDDDGYLDLYVTQYVTHDADKQCTQADGSADYCSPQVFPGTSDVLYRNRAGRGFEDVSARAGIRRARAPGLGVLCADLDGDARLDFYVANDGEANQLWINQGDGTFVDDAFLLGAALSDAGEPEAGMGITIGDIDADGDFDLFMTHLVNQTNTLYVSEGDVGYADRSTASGLGGPSLAYTGFGTGFLDFDHDGDLDLAIGNGRVQRQPLIPGAEGSESWSVYAEPNQLLENDDGRYADVSSSAGDFGARVEVSRALAFGDVDNDGDIDILVANAGSSARLYRNDSAKRGHWLGLSVQDKERRRDAYGAVVTVTTSEDKRYLRLAHPGFSFLASNDPRVHFGLPEGATVDKIEVRWPDGSHDAYPGAALDRYITLEKGAGR